MKPATRLTGFQMWFRGPQTPELFQFDATDQTEGYDHFIVGEGDSRAQAAARALSKLRTLDIGPIRAEIEGNVQRGLSQECSLIEADDPDLSMFCVIGISVKR